MAEVNVRNTTRELIWELLLSVLREDGKLDNCASAVGEDTSFGDIGLQDSLSVVHLTGEVGQPLGIYRTLYERITNPKNRGLDVTLGQFVDWACEILAQTARNRGYEHASERH